MNYIESDDPQLNRIQRWAVIAAGAGVLLCALGAFLDLEQFFQSYLVSFLFWLGIALGCFVWLTIHFMAGGIWSLALRRFMETGTLMTVLMAVLFLPIAFGIGDLYIWSQSEIVAASEVLLHKRPYLNVPFFLARVVLYFAIWIALALVIWRWSGEQDREGDPRIAHRLRLVAAPALLLYGLTVTFASVDWIMALDPHWFSTIFGAMIAAGQALAAFAFVLVVFSRLSARESFTAILRSQHIFHLGNLLLTAIILWSYLAFMQYLIIWSGNIPEEVLWYVHRLEGGWQWVALFWLLFHFVLPFAVLLMRWVRLRVDLLSYVALTILVANWAHLLWLVAPTFHAEGFYLHWLDVAALLAIGGIWVAVFLWQLSQRPLVPVHDRVLEGIREHGLEEPPVTTAGRARSLR